MTVVDPAQSHHGLAPEVYREDLGPVDQPSVRANQDGGSDRMTHSQRRQSGPAAPTVVRSHPEWKGVSNSAVMLTDTSGRLGMRGVKRESDGQQQAPTKPPRLTETGIRDVDIFSNHFFVLNCEALDEEYRCTRAYAEKICEEMNARKDVYKGSGWTTSVEKSKSHGQTADVGLFPAVEFRADLKEPDEECLHWFPFREGILMVKMRPGLICENADFGLRVRLLTGFGNSDPRRVKVKDADGNERSKLADYVQVLEWPSRNVAPEAQCYRKPIYFRSTVKDFPFNRPERFAPVANYYVHLHTTPYRVVGHLYSKQDFEGLVELENAAAKRLIQPAKMALERYTDALERGDDPDLGNADHGKGSMQQGDASGLTAAESPDAGGIDRSISHEGEGGSILPEEEEETVEELLLRKEAQYAEEDHQQAAFTAKPSTGLTTFISRTKHQLGRLGVVGTQSLDLIAEDETEDTTRRNDTDMVTESKAGSTSSIHETDHLGSPSTERMVSAKRLEESADEVRDTTGVRDLDIVYDDEL